MTRRKKRFRLRVQRDTVLFLAGLIGVYHETFVASTERISLLVLFAGMLGLPAFLGMDEWKKRKDEEDEDSDL